MSLRYEDVDADDIRRLIRSTEEATARLRRSETRLVRLGKALGVDVEFPFDENLGRVGSEAYVEENDEGEVLRVQHLQVTLEALYRVLVNSEVTSPIPVIIGDRLIGTLYPLGATLPA